MEGLIMTSDQNWYKGDFLESFIWLSKDHSKNNFKNDYLIFFPLFINMDMKEQINMCLFMSVKCILILIKFDIDINNN